MATDREDCSRRCGSAVSAGTTRHLRWHWSWRRTRQKRAWDCRLLGGLVRRPTAQLSPHGIRSTIEGATPHHPPGCSGSLRKWHLYKALKGSLHKHRGCAWFLSILYIFFKLGGQFYYPLKEKSQSGEADHIDSCHRREMKKRENHSFEFGLWRLSKRLPGKREETVEKP